MREFREEEVVIKEGKYVEVKSDADLILRCDTVRGRYFGVSRSDEVLDDLRQGLVVQISQELAGIPGRLRSEILKEIANIFYNITVRSPSESNWFLLPSDTRPGANQSSMADHILLTSAIATSLLQEAFIRGKDVNAIVRVEPPFDRDELFHLTRIASFTHDLGKHPHIKHRERGMRLVEDLFASRLDASLVERLAGVALRHHSSIYTLPGEEPQGFFEELICHADSASGADRITELPEEEWGKNFAEIQNLTDNRGFHKYPQTGEAIHNLLRAMKEWEEAEFPGRPPLSLIFADVDQVKRYVFESAKLPEVRGASLILDDLNRKGIKEILCEEGLKLNGETYRLSPESILYAAGGSALILCPSSLAEEICKGIERLYLRETSWATISAVSLSIHLYELPYGFHPFAYWFDKFKERWKNVEGSPARGFLDNFLASLDKKEENCIPDPQVQHFQRFLKTKRFGELTARLSYELRKRKDARSTYPLFEATPFARRCDSCEIRPAHKKEVPEELYLCEVCLKKREKGSRRAKAGFVEKFEDYLRENRKEAHFRSYLEKMELLKDEVKVPESLGSIGQIASGRAEGYIGVIYADGDNIGEHLNQIQTPAVYRNFSNSLLETINHAVFTSLAAYLRPEEVTKEEGGKEHIHPFEIISIGGDDLFLIVPGDAALEIPHSICRIFQEEFKDGAKLTMSAGVVIAKAHTPIYFLRTLAEQLLKSAKKRTTEVARKGERTGCMDFLVLTSMDMAATDLEVIRQKVYTTQVAHEVLHLTERPLTLDQMVALINGASKLRDAFPHSQLYSIRQSLESGRLWSRNFLYYQLARMGDEEKDPLEKFINSWWQSLSERDHVPFRKVDDRWVTPFVDLVEILDYVKGAINAI